MQKHENFFKKVNDKNKKLTANRTAIEDKKLN